MGIAVTKSEQTQLRATDCILVVDDDPIFANYLRELLEAHGHRVEIAESGDEGVRQAAQSPPQLIILDILMPDVDGIEVIRRLQEGRCASPVIAISGGGRMDAEIYLKLAYQLGARHVFRKPIVEEELCQAIDAVLAT